MSDVTLGQVWRRKPAGYLYKVKAITGDTFGSIVLLNLHDFRESRISPQGLRKKFELTDLGRTARLSSGSEEER